MQPTPAADSDSRRPRLIAALVLVLTLAVFARVAHQNFVDWDDGLHTYDNPHLETLGGLRWLWRYPYYGLYIPLSYMAYALLAALAQHHAPLQTPQGGWTTLDPRVFHDANLVLHLANTLLVFLLLRRLLRPGQSAALSSGQDWAAGAGALLFGVHPLQVETVAWISELRGLLCAFFSLLATWQCVRLAQRDTSGRAALAGYAPATVGFLAALLCKPSAVALPLIVLALDHGVVGRPWRRCVPPMLGWLFLSAAWLCLTRDAQALGDTPPAVWTRPLIAGDTLWFYGIHLLWPTRLGPDYGRTPAWALAHRAWLTACVPPLAALLLRRWYRGTPLPAAGAIFVAALLPVLGLVPFGFQSYSTVADRYAYLALLGPALAAGWLLARSASRPRARVPATAVTVLLLCLCGLRSAAQVRTWDGALSFTANAIAVNPNSWTMHFNRGHYWQRRGHLTDAAAEYRRAIRANPAMTAAHVNLGYVLIQQGLDAPAEAELSEAMRLDPRLPQPHVALGDILASRGDTAGAAAQWETAVTDWPNAPLLRYNLGMALAKLGRTTEAAVQFRAALRLQPRFVPAQASPAQALRGPTHPASSGV